MPMVDEIADDLAANGFGQVGTSIFTHHRPADPDEAMSLHQFAIGKPMVTMSGAAVCEEVGLQVQCRAATDPAAEAACYDVFARYKARSNLSIGGTWYLGISGRKSPQKLFVDQQGRSVFYCEFTVLKSLG